MAVPALSLFVLKEIAMFPTPTQFRFRALALLATGALLGTSAAMAADNGTAARAEAQYRQDRIACDRGQTAESHATCMREAGAALQENLRNHLVNAGPEQLQQNALVRCDPLPPDDRQACQARMQGQGEVSGSVAGGGLLREIVTDVPAAQDEVPQDTPQEK
jgi:hypothetical protein